MFVPIFLDMSTGYNKLLTHTQERIQFATRSFWTKIISN